MDSFEQTQHSYPKQEPWKIIAIIVIAVVILVIVILFAVRLIGSRKQQASIAVRNDRLSEQVDDQLESCADTANPEGCRTKKIKDAASSLGIASICNKLEGVDFDNCIWDLAKKKNNPEDCQYIKDEESKLVCADNLYSILARTNNDIDYCKEIKDEIRNSQCIKYLSKKLAETEGCDSDGVDASVCETHLRLQDIIATRNPASCDVFESETDKESCLDSVGYGDIDGDGLDAEEESMYGTDDTKTDTDGDSLSDYDEVNEWDTDPLNTDTDGDGFSDSDEINAGYSPTGEGKL